MEYEIKTLCSIFNCSFEELIEYQDMVCLKFLLSNMEYTNFENRLAYIKRKDAERHNRRRN
jgi:hypothetical protein